MTHRKLTTLLATAVLALPGFAAAEDLSYDYLDLSYAETEIDVGDTDVDGDGLTLAGSLAVAPNWHLFADFAATDFDFGIDATTLRAGGGYNHSISESADVIARLFAIRTELELDGGGDSDDTGIGIGVGVRAFVMPSLELEGAIDYVDVEFAGDASGETLFTGGARYFVTPQIALGGTVSIGDEFTTFGINGRFNFR